MKSKFEASIDNLKEIEMNAYAYELIREIVLPDMLGQDYSSMMYWAGKHLARKFPLESWEEFPAFFEEAGWGTLTNVSAKKQELEFELEGRSFPTGLNIRKNLAFSWRLVLSLNKFN